MQAGSKIESKREQIWHEPADKTSGEATVTDRLGNKARQGGVSPQPEIKEMVTCVVSTICIWLSSLAVLMT